MPSKKLSIASNAVLAIFTATLLMTAARASAQQEQEKVLYSFGPTYQDAVIPGFLIFDAVGNLYGTSFGGVNGTGRSSS